MLNIFQMLVGGRILRPLLKPVTRFFLGFIAIPIFRFLMRKVVRVHEVDEELEKDLEQWFRGALLLLVATDNMEASLFSWMPQAARDTWFFEASRILLAIGVIEGMPDQSLFAIIHPGPQKPTMVKGQFFQSLIRYAPDFFKGLICQHLNRSSPVLAILSVLHSGVFGWTCYGMAIAQYLLIGLVTSRDKALDVLSRFDAETNRQREELESELERQRTARLSQGTITTSAVPVE